MYNQNGNGYNQNGGYGAPNNGYNGQQSNGYGNQPQNNGGYGAPNGGYNGQQGNGYNNQPQNNGGYGAPNNGYNNQPQGNGQNGGERQRPYSTVLVHRPVFKNQQGKWEFAPLDQAVLAVTLRPGDNGDHLAVNYGVSQEGKPYLRLNFDLKMGDKAVADLFGPEMVREDKTVEFTVFINGEFNVNNMLQHPPKATQYLMIQVAGMKVGEYTARDGRVRKSVTGNANGYQKFGTTKKRDGTDSKNIVIFGAENAQTPQQGGYGVPNGGYGQQQGGYSAPNGGYGQPVGGYNPPMGVNGLESFSEMSGDDDELPF